MGPKADPRKLRQYKLYANTENNELSFRELKFLGHVLSGEGIRPNPKKIQTIREWEVSGHRSEWGFFMFGQLLLKIYKNNFKIKSHLIKLAEKGEQVLKWDETC